MTSISTTQGEVRRLTTETVEEVWQEQCVEGRGTCLQNLLRRWGAPLKDCPLQHADPSHLCPLASAEAKAPLTQPDPRMLTRFSCSYAQSSCTELVPLSPRDSSAGAGSDIPEVWVEILETRTLHLPSLVGGFAGSGTWLRFPVRETAAFRFPKRCGRDEFLIDGKWHNGDQLANAFHHCRLESLVRSHQWAPGSRGILHQGLHFGTCTHTGKCGVSFYAEDGAVGVLDRRARVGCTRTSGRCRLSFERRLERQVLHHKGGPRIL